MPPGPARIPVLYVAPWVDYGGTDKGTIDWFRWIDRERFAPYLVTTQPSPNRRLAELVPYAEEVWALPDLMAAERMPGFLFDLMQSRQIQVLHLMNSRLGFDLLPDLGCLPRPPAVVVQLHVEETDRSGYVRYVTTRYGNLVDRFSVSSEHLADAVCGYGVPRERVRVIYTGVDPEGEFSPRNAEPVDGLDRDRLQILYPARLVEQKDPLLMVDVAAALRDRDVRFQVHALGEGHLEAAVRDRLQELALEDRVLLHPPTAEPQRWYAACDAVLLTSVYEGVPYVIFEAMAMGVPVVAPALPGNVELLGAGGEGLVEPRASVAGYADVLAGWASDSDALASRGREMRQRASDRFSLRRMASDHGELYEELAVVARPAPPSRADDLLPPARFLDRPIAGTPLVSVLVPHFNQARFLAECVESIRAQTYPAIELIVVDDASTEAEADLALAQLEAGGDATVIRLEENGGPSRARNAGLERCGGRYVLPVDADNLLLPNAVENLVAQLSEAGEEVGFIYPNLQYFGNREDYYEVPEYNVHTLLYGNFCDTCSLFDREVFDAGVRYSEEIRLGHEDWEFTLRLAALGVRGEAAHGPTVRYRKWGFNRSDEVDHAPEEFHELLAEISPLSESEAEIKAREAPSLSLVPLAAVDAAGAAGNALAQRLAAQQCTDLELIARFDGEWPAPAGVPPVRRIPAALARSSLEAARTGLTVARGAFAALTSAPAGDLLADRGFVEKALRRFVVDREADEPLEPDAIALVDAGADGRYAFRPLGAADGPARAAPHTLLWRRAAERDLPRGPQAEADDPVGSLARLFSGAGLRVEWRHFPVSGTIELEDAQRGIWSPLPEGRANDEDPQGLRPAARPLLPGDGEHRVPRWEKTPSWIPALSTIAIRYRERHGSRRLVTNGVWPEGFVPEHHLGALRSGSLEGTTRIVRIGDDYAAIPRGEWHSAPAGAEDIGYAELAALPQLDSLALAVHRATGQRTLVTLPEDPLLDEVDLIETLGYLDPFPARPRSIPPAERPYGLLGLTMAIDYRERRHRYAIGTMPEGDFVGELGGLGESGWQGSVAAWIVDGRLVTERHRPPAPAATALQTARWVAEPIAWGGLAPAQARVRSGLRRAVTASLLSRRTPVAAEPAGDPEGWLFATARGGRVPLYASYHPVTGDQLLGRSSEEAAQLGFGAPELLGFVRRIAPLTDDLAPRHPSIPWARRFGAVPRPR